jgi:hypothetical protein
MEEHNYVSKYNSEYIETVEDLYGGEEALCATEVKGRQQCAGQPRCRAASEVPNVCILASAAR